MNEEPLLVFQSAIFLGAEYKIGIYQLVCKVDLNSESNGWKTLQPKHSDRSLLNCLLDERRDKSSAKLSNEKTFTFKVRQ